MDVPLTRQTGHIVHDYALTAYLKIAETAVGMHYAHNSKQLFAAVPSRSKDAAVGATTAMVVTFRLTG